MCRWRPPGVADLQAVQRWQDLEEVALLEYIEGKEGFLASVPLAPEGSDFEEHALSSGAATRRSVLHDWHMLSRQLLYVSGVQPHGQ